jgi:hypothetical protein
MKFIKIRNIQNISFSSNKFKETENSVSIGNDEILSAMVESMATALDVTTSQLLSYINENVMIPLLSGMREKVLKFYDEKEYAIYSGNTRIGSFTTEHAPRIDRTAESLCACGKYLYTSESNTYSAFKSFKFEYPIAELYLNRFIDDINQTNVYSIQLVNGDLYTTIGTYTNTIFVKIAISTLEVFPCAEGLIYTRDKKIYKYHPNCDIGPYDDYDLSTKCYKMPGMALYHVSDDGIIHSGDKIDKTIHRYPMLRYIRKQPQPYMKCHPVLDDVKFNWM